MNREESMLRRPAHNKGGQESTSVINDLTEDKNGGLWMWTTSSVRDGEYSIRPRYLAMHHDSEFEGTEGSNGSVC